MFLPMRVFFCVLGIVWSAGFARAELSPVWYKLPAGEVVLRKSIKVIGGARCAAPGERVVLSAEMADDSPEKVELQFDKGGAIEDVTFEVGKGGVLQIIGCSLRRVCLTCRPGGVIDFKDCVLDECLFSTNNGYLGAAGEKPEIRLMGCHLEKCSVNSPLITGLKPVLCRFTRCEFDALKKDARVGASLSRCWLEECTLANVETLVAAGNVCLFTHSKLLTPPDDSTGDYLEQPLTVSLRWEDGSPAQLPSSAGTITFVQMEPMDSLQSVAYGPARQEIEIPTASPVPLLMVIEERRLGEAKPVMLPLTPGAVLPRTAPVSADADTMNMAITATTVAPGAVFKEHLVQANGLLISQMSGGEASQVSKLTLSTLPVLGSSPSTLSFNQKVGEDMLKALNEVSKFSQLRHDGWPGGHVMEIGFEDKYVPKDGPSAAVACALLIEGAITGKKWDPLFAVTGDMNADGSVQAIGGVQAKVRGATKGGCKIVGIPLKNEKAIPDILILEGPAPLLQIGIFSISSFDEAAALADPKRAEALARALAEMENVRNVLSRMSGPQMAGTLRTPQAVARLQYILQAAPNCLSAKYLLLFAQGHGPRFLSIGGSLEAANSSARYLIRSIESDVESNVNTLKGDDVGTCINKLKNLRPKLDPRVWPYVDNVVIYGEVIRGSILNPVRSGARFADLVEKAGQAAFAARAALEKITGDPQVREELGL